ncbi:MAG: phosphate starvation-inducible protein PhoH, partial [Firmicutes bacterium]|nr:phosphate starvation-inducible protein PhoH [Bacillota bacterium]
MTEEFDEHKLYLNNMDEVLPLLGKFDEHLSLVEENFAVRIIPRGDELSFSGEEKDVAKVYSLFQELLSLIRGGHLITTSEFMYALKLAQQGQIKEIKGLFN